MRKRYLTPSIGLVALIGCLPASALGVSAVTSPSATVVYTYDVDNPTSPSNTIAASGTASAGPVDVVCSQTLASGPAFDSLAAGVAVNAGTWSASGSLLATVFPCRIRAVVPGTLATDSLVDFTGPLVLAGTTKRYQSVGGRTRGFFAAASQTEGYADFKDFGTCGLYDMNLVAGETVSPELFYCNNYAEETVTTPVVSTPRSAILVDDKHSYAPGVNPGDKPGLPAISWAATRDASTGAMSVSETDAITSCATSPTTTRFSDAGCTAMTSSGVRLSRTMVQSNSGRTVEVTDRWVSTDGAAHRLDLWTSDEFLSPQTAFRPSWAAGTYQVHAGGDSLVPPQDGPATLFVRTAAGADNDFTKPQGSITFATPPLELKWKSSQGLQAHFVRSVPASGELVLRRTYNTAATTAQVESSANRASSVFSTPTLVVANPATGAQVTSSRLAISGTATDRDAIRSVTMNGQVLGVSAAGAFATTVDLTAGQNTITVVATSSAGTQTTVTRTVTYTPPTVPPPAPLLTLKVNGPAFIKTKLAKVTIKGTSSGYALIRVNGRAVKPAADGTWRVTLRGLRKGRTAVLIVAGYAPSQAVAQRVIRYTPPKRTKK